MDSYSANLFHLLRLPPELRYSAYEKYLGASSTAHKATKISQLQAQSFNFFGLPAELRLHIYEYLLKPAKVDIYSYDLSLDVDEESDTVEAPDSVTTIIPYARWIGPKRLNPAILRTCRTVYAEAWKILYRPYALSLRPAFAYLRTSNGNVVPESRVRVLHEIPRPLNLSKLACIHQLSRLELEIYTTPKTGAVDIVHSKALITSFRGRMPVKNLELKIFNIFFDCCADPKHKHDVERKTIVKLVNRWSKIIAPTELKVLVGSKPGLVMECHGKADGSWSRQDLVDLTGKSVSSDLLAILTKIQAVKTASASFCPACCGDVLDIRKKH